LKIKFYEFHQVLPRLDRRRVLVNFGGTILKAQFGTATVDRVPIYHSFLRHIKKSHQRPYDGTDRLHPFLRDQSLQSTFHQATNHSKSPPTKRLFTAKHYPPRDESQ